MNGISQEERELLYALALERVEGLRTGIRPSPNPVDAAAEALVMAYQKRIIVSVVPSE